MKRRTAKTIRFALSQIKPPSQKDLVRLERAGASPIDTREIPEVRSMKRHGPIWHAITDGMHRQGLSGHGLWKRAQPFCPRMPESAVYEFLGVRLMSSRRKRAG
jgi:hypothetical protein